MAKFFDIALSRPKFLTAKFLKWWRVLYPSFGHEDNEYLAVARFLWLWLYCSCGACRMRYVMSQIQIDKLACNDLAAYGSA